MSSGANARDTTNLRRAPALYVVNGGAHTINAFSVDGGTLTELASSPTAGAPGATPSGIVVN